MDILIYGLVDPRTNEIRYVGKTTQTLNKRLSQHLCSNKKHNPHKFNWINQLKTLNLKPTIILIETCNDKNWVEREKHYILTIENLTNITQGGENGSVAQLDSSDSLLSCRSLVQIQSGSQYYIFRYPHSGEMG